MLQFLVNITMVEQRTSPTVCVLIIFQSDFNILAAKVLFSNIVHARNVFNGEYKQINLHCNYICTGSTLHWVVPVHAYTVLVVSVRIMQLLEWGASEHRPYIILPKCWSTLFVNKDFDSFCILSCIYFNG